MTDSSQTIRVNFGRPMAIFPLQGVVLLPHAVLPLHIFEERYRQMVEDALDGSGQIAMAVYDGGDWDSECFGDPPVKPVVCVGQIAQHEKMYDGRHNILLQGVCRARIEEEEPAEGDRLYRRARLRPLGVEESEAGEEELVGVRERLRSLLSEPPLTQLSASEGIRRWLEREEAPVQAVLELIGMSVVGDNELKYRLLAEPDPSVRASIVEEELVDLRRLLSRAEKQLDPEAPKGCSWN
jgi:Lon protease-like protein